MAERRTLRLDLPLFASTEQACPEFNYRQLAAAAQGNTSKPEKEKRKSANGLPDDLSDNDEDVERIAKQFEQKYGSSSTYGKTKGRSKQDDYADIGAGYDENDSFIDNTDGYDEMMPPECDTAYGGFYINSGSLEFKNIAGTSVSAGEGAAGDSSPTTHKKAHKRPLSSSESEEESSSSDEDSEGSGVEKSHETDVKSAKTVSVTDSDKSGEDRKKSKTDKINAKDGLPHKKRKSSQEGSTSSGQETSVKKVDEPADPRTNGIENSSDSRSSDSSKPRVVPSSDNHASSDSSRDAVPPKTAVVVKPAPTPVVVQLPPNVSSEIQMLIDRLKSLTESHFASRTGKLSGSELNDIILGLELQCKRSKESRRSRNNIFAYAAQLLRRGKAGLLQRARRLAEEHQRTSTSASTSPMDRLKTVIEKMKPSLLDNYKVEAQKIKEINRTIAIQNANLEDDKKIPERRLPKRRFPWNDQVRNLLRELMRSRGMDTESKEESTVRFLQTVVLPLFPSGFVRMPTLLQQVRSAKSAKNNGDASKKVLNKPLEVKLPPTVTATPIKPPQVVEKHISDPETVSTPANRPKVKAPTSSICVGTDSDEGADATKGNETSSSAKSDRVLSVALERLVTSNDKDKSDFYKVQTDKVTGAQIIANNVSISLTSVFPNKCDNEKTSSHAKSVIIQPVSDAAIECEKVLEHVKNSNEISITLNNPNTVIKSVESCNYDSPSSVSYLKVKSPSSLFDKNPKCKISPTKNTSVDILTKSSAGYDESKVKNYTADTQKSEKVFNKPAVQDCSHLIKRKPPVATSPTIVAPKPTVVTPKPTVVSPKLTAVSPKPTVVSPKPSIVSPKPSKSPNDFAFSDFLKPQKLDYPYNRYSTSPNQNSGNVRSKYPEMNGNPQESLQITSISSSDRKHSFTKPITKPTDLCIARENSSHKSPRIVKNADNYEVLVNLDKQKSDRDVSSHKISQSDQYDAGKYKKDYAVNQASHEDSSDDCIEILDEDMVPHKPYQVKVEDTPRQKVVSYKIPPVTAPKVDVRDKPYKSVDNSPNWFQALSKQGAISAIQVPIEYVSKKMAMKKVSVFNSDADDAKRHKSDRAQDKDVDVFTNENASDILSLNSNLRSESVSVIKDTIAIKSDRITDIVPEKRSALHVDDINQEDVNQVMQDLKELQNFQMSSSDNHQRLYDDPSNNVCHTTSLPSETEPRLYKIRNDGMKNLDCQRIGVEQ